MISAIEIEGLRGIKHGKLEGLTPLTILTGPNGCGKSTVLDALLIGANVSPDQGVIQAVQRRPETRNGARWLIRNGSSSISCAVDDRSLATTLKLGSAEPITIVVGESGYLEFSPENKAHIHRTYGLRPDVAEIKLIDPALVISLYRVFSQVVREGRRQEVQDLFRQLDPEALSLEILTEDSDMPVLNVVKQNYAVPVSLSGDGIQAFLQLALSLSSVLAGELVLVEEPEVCQHPKSIWQSALAILGTMRRGVQVVLTTHSLELIDALLGHANDDDLEKMSVFNLALVEGELRSSRSDGERIMTVRDQLDMDLR
jgi:predicted ATPase